VKTRHGKEIPLNAEGNRVVDYNEIEAHVIMHVQTGTEAATRMYQVPVVMSSHTVIPLYIHNEKEEPTVTFTEGEEEEARDRAEASLARGYESKLMSYFKLCSNPNEAASWKDKTGKKQGLAAADLLFTEIPTYYIWKNVSKILLGFAQPAF
jgi:hypothetical protein